jgi:hypothetical protein
LSTQEGTLSTFAGTREPHPSDTDFRGAWESVAVDTEDNVYFGEDEVFRVTPEGEESTLLSSDDIDGELRVAALAVDDEGTVFIADEKVQAPAEEHEDSAEEDSAEEEPANRILRLAPNGRVDVIADAEPRHGVFAPLQFQQDSRLKCTSSVFSAGSLVQGDQAGIDRIRFARVHHTLPLGRAVHVEHSHQEGVLKVGEVVVERGLPDLDPLRAQRVIELLDGERTTGIGEEMALKRSESCDVGHVVALDDSHVRP